VLHLEPVPLRAQLAAQLVEQRTPLKDMASSASTMLPEAIREQEEREEEKAKLEAGTATTDGAQTTASTSATAANNTTASSSSNNTFLTAFLLSSCGGPSATAPSALPPLSAAALLLRLSPLCLNGLLLCAPPLLSSIARCLRCGLQLFCLWHSSSFDTPLFLFFLRFLRPQASKAAGIERTPKKTKFEHKEGKIEN
jgi:hypothetical protein